jgi:hypothetical protein
MPDRHILETFPTIPVVIQPPIQDRVPHLETVRHSFASPLRENGAPIEPITTKEGLEDVARYLEGA